MKHLKRGLALALVLLALLTGGFLAGRASADQPHMRNALAALKTARDELWAATPNKGGHRERALDLVNDAIYEVQAGIDFAEGNP
jgi:hypothetical protein